jgi:hypothetical protein
MSDAAGQLTPVTTSNSMKFAKAQAKMVGLQRGMRSPVDGIDTMCLSDHRRRGRGLCPTRFRLSTAACHKIHRAYIFKHATGQRQELFFEINSVWVISLACRRIIELENFTSQALTLSVFFHTEFMNDEDAVSQYTFTSRAKKYAIRRRDPPSPKFKASLGENPPSDPILGALPPSPRSKGLLHKMPDEIAEGVSFVAFRIPANPLSVAHPDGEYRR